MADDTDVGSALTGWLGQFAQRIKPPQVVENFTPNNGQRLLDRREDKVVVADPDEFTPFWKGAMDFYHVPRSMTEGVAGPHTNNPMAKSLGYNDIHKPTPEEMARFLAEISQMDAKARAIGPDMSADDLKIMNDPIGRWLQRDQ